MALLREAFDVAKPLWIENGCHDAQSVDVTEVDPFAECLALQDRFDSRGTDTELLAGDKLIINKAAAKYLSEILSPHDSEANRRRMPRLRDCCIEPSLLSSVDPELELWTLRERHRVDLSDICRSVRIVDSDGYLLLLQWSETEEHAFETTKSRTHKERLTVDSKAVSYIRDLLSIDEHHKISLSQHGIPKILKDDVLPILPLSPPANINELPTTLREIPYASSVTDLLHQELMTIETHMFEDYIDPQGEDMASPMLYLETLWNHVENVSLSSQDIDAGTVQRLEPPILPLHVEDERSRKRRRLSLNRDRLGLSLDEVSLDLLLNPDEMIFDEPTVGNNVTRLADCEQLDDLDTILRLPPPKIPDFMTMLPWDAGASKGLHSQKETTIRFAQLCNDCDFALQPIPGISTLESNLRWDVFPLQLAEINDCESNMHGEEGSDDYISSMTILDSPRAQPLTSSSPELQLFRQSTSDQCIIDPLTKSRQQHLSCFEHETIAQAHSLQPNGNPPHTCDTYAERDAVNATLTAPRADYMLGRGQNVPVSQYPKNESTLHTGLVNFLKLKGKAPPPKLIESTNNSSSGDLLKSISSIVTPVTAISRDPPALTDSFQCPSVTNTTDIQQLVAYPSAVRNTEMLRRLQGIMPALDILERRLPIAIDDHANCSLSKVHVEADLNLAPGIGVILTSIQKLKQKALPGQVGFFGVRSQISVLVTSYERLIVLVGDGGVLATSKHSASLDASDCEVLADLIAFTQTLDMAVEVYFTPGTEDQRTQWIAALICQINADTRLNFDPGTSLIHEETLWEQVLRASGLDSFTAQVILSQLKGSLASDTTLSTPSSRMPLFGLSSFVDSSTAERIAHFATLLGGDRMISRACALLDAVRRPALKFSSIV